jgi:hypothetical protein
MQPIIKHESEHLNQIPVTGDTVKCHTIETMIQPIRPFNASKSDHARTTAAERIATTITTTVKCLPPRHRSRTGAIMCLSAPLDTQSMLTRDDRQALCRSDHDTNVAVNHTRHLVTMIWRNLWSSQSYKPYQANHRGLPPSTSMLSHRTPFPSAAIMKDLQQSSSTSPRTTANHPKDQRAHRPAEDDEPGTSTSTPAASTRHDP